MSKTILIVNDEEDVAEVTKELLKSEGYSVCVLKNGEEVLGWLKENNTDLVLLDLLLTGIQGDEVCRSLKNNDAFKNIPVLILSANSCDVQKIANDCKADGLISIPYDPDDLLKKIRGMI